MSVKQPVFFRMIVAASVGACLFWAACSDRVLSFTSEGEGVNDGVIPPDGSSSTTSGGGSQPGAAGAPPDDTTGSEHGLVNTPG